MKQEQWKQKVAVLLAAWEQRFPQMWAKCYPRRYNVVGSYDTPKAVGYAMMDAFLSYAKGGKQTEEIEAMWAASMAQYQVPTYYVGHDLAEALLNTTPSLVIDWMSMKLPFEAAAFMVPAGMLPHPSEDGEISFVAYARTRADENLPLPNPMGANHLIGTMKDNFNVIVRVNSGCTMHWTLDHSFNQFSLRQGDDGWGIKTAMMHTGNDPGSAFNDADTEVMRKAVRLLFNLLLFMTSKPEMVEDARMEKRVKSKQGVPLEYWMPHIVGRTYKLHRPYVSQGGTHASPRGHWVSGFWREQPFGEGRKLRRNLWIEPYWRGGDALTKSVDH